MSDFWSKFVILCNKAGVSPSIAAQNIGFSSAAPVGWKKGAVPRDSALFKIADYFGVPVSYFMEDDEQQEKPLVNNDEELTDYLQELKDRPEMRMLFDVSKKAKKEDIEAVVQLFERMIGKENE